MSIVVDLYFLWKNLPPKGLKGDRLSLSTGNGGSKSPKVAILKVKVLPLSSMVPMVTPHYAPVRAY